MELGLNHDDDGSTDCHCFSFINCIKLFKSRLPLKILYFPSLTLILRKNIH